MAVKRVGIFGGSFDPVHWGHLLAASAAVDELALDRLYFVPAAQSPFKPDNKLAPAQDRAAMLRLASAGQPRWRVETSELERGGVSYTIDTVEHVRRRHREAELFCLIGGDHVASLEQWRRASELAALATFVVMPRPGQTVPERKDFRVRVLEGCPTDVSSSTIRRRLRAGRSARYLTPEAVIDFIEHKRLYL